MPGLQNQARSKKKRSLKFGPTFCPKLGEDQKEKVFTRIWSYFLPKIRCRPKKRSPLEFGPIFCPKLGEDQIKKGLNSIWVPHSNLVQNLTRQPQLFRAPLPFEPPSRRPWVRAGSKVGSRQ